MEITGVVEIPWDRTRYIFFIFIFQGQDRTFLEELLLYLRQQRRQLDESRRLLENLEREYPRLFDEGGGEIPLSVHIPPGESRTTPTSSHLPSATVHVSTSFNSPSPSRTHHSSSSTPHTSPRTHSKSSTSYRNQTVSTAGTNYGTQTVSTPGTSYGTRTLTPGVSGSPPGLQTRLHSSGTQTRSAATTGSFGVQTSYAPPGGSPTAGGSPRGMATIGLVTRSGPVVNGYGGSGGSGGRGVSGGAASSGGDGARDKVDLTSLYEQCKEVISLP